jgi:hypothetical protein
VNPAEREGNHEWVLGSASVAYAAPQGDKYLVHYPHLLDRDSLFSPAKPEIRHSKATKPNNYCELKADIQGVDGVLARAHGLTP